MSTFRSAANKQQLHEQPDAYPLQTADAAGQRQPDQQPCSSGQEPKVTFQSPCMTIRQLRPPQQLDKDQYKEYVDAEGIMRPVTGDEAVFAFAARGQQSGRVLEQRDAKHPRVLLLGDPKVPLGLGIALAQIGLGEKADVTISAKLMHTTADADGRAHVLRGTCNSDSNKDALKTAAAHDEGQYRENEDAHQAPARPSRQQTQGPVGMQHAGSLLDELQAEVHADEGVVYEGLELLAIVPGHGKRAAKPIMADTARQQAGKGSGLTYHQVKKQAAAHAGDGTNPQLLPRKRKNWCRRNCTIDFMAPWKAMKAVAAGLGLRDLAIGRKLHSKQANQAQQQQEEQEAQEMDEGPRPGSMAVLTAH